MPVEGFEDRNALARLGGVIVALPIRLDAKLLCSDEGDLSVTPVEVPNAAYLAYFNSDNEVVEVQCLYHG